MNYTLDIDIHEPIEDAVDEIVNELEEAIYNIRKYTRPEIVHAHDVDIQDLLAQHKAIGLVFAIADAKKLRPDLSDEQAWEVLQMFEAAAEDCPDPMWETMRQLADAHFPRQRRAKPMQLAKIVADYDPHGDERDNLVDLLADAYHWCEELGEPLEEFLAAAKLHFTQENRKGVRA